MLQDYENLSDEQMDLLEKQTLRVIVQALQEYSRESKQIFDNTWAESKQEVIVLAEDLTQYALEVAEVYAINQRFAGFIDYKRVRWMPIIYGLIPQVLLCDAKASTENNRDTLQQSQLPMDAEYLRDGEVMNLKAAFPLTLSSRERMEHFMRSLHRSLCISITRNRKATKHLIAISDLFSPSAFRTID